MQTVKINAIERTRNGKAASARDRRSGLVPCVLYARNENIQFCANPSELRHLIYTPDFKLAEIKLNGSVHRCILKELQYHPVTDQVTHVDFLKLIDGVPVKVEVPLRLKGNAVGVKSGGKLVSRMRTIKIKATPDKLVSEVFLDISSLDLGQTFRIRDITAQEGIEILNPGATPVVSVEIPRALKTESPAAAETTSK